MNTWYKFILNALFSKKREDKDWETTDKEEDVLSNYIELDSLMQVIYHAKDSESGSYTKRPCLLYQDFYNLSLLPGGWK